MVYNAAKNRQEKASSYAAPPPASICGYTVDTAGTNRRHQMGSITPYDQSDTKFQFNYSVALPQSYLDVDRPLPRRFVEAVNSNSRQGQSAATTFYNSLENQLVDKKTRLLLTRNAFIPVLTFGFVVDSDAQYAIGERSLSVDMGRISHALYVDEANAKCSDENSPNHVLLGWHEFALHHRDGKHLTTKPKQKFNFCEATNQITQIVSNTASELGFTRNVNCIHRRKAMQNAEELPYYASRLNALESGESPDDWSVPTTKTTHLVSALNILALSHFAMTRESLFTLEESTALAVMAERTHRQATRDMPKATIQ